MAIQLRRGAYANFDPAKMLPAEVGVVTSGDPGTADGKAAYVAFAAGNVKKLATVDDIAAEIDGAVDEAVQRAEDVAESIEASAAQIETNRTDIADIKEDLSHVFSDNAKAALLACFAKVAWIDEHGQDYYNVLEAALYADSYPRIRATYTQSANVVYTDDALDTLKPYLTVKLYESNTDTGTTISSNDYSLSGVLTEGTSTISVAYESLRTSVDIPGVVDFYNIAEWSTSDRIAVNMGNIVTEKFPEIVSNTVSTNRAIVTCPHGKKEILQYNSDNPIPFEPSRYPIPIPNGATNATITCIGGRPIMSVFRYENNQYTRLREINNTTWNQGNFEIGETGQNLFGMFLMVTGENNPPSEVTITYSFD